jgi:cell division cycle 2-like protein
MNILSAIDHPYIVGVKEIVVGTDLNSIFMVMEIANHDLCENESATLHHCAP